MNPTHTIKAGLMALVFHLGITVAVQAGGPALLQLPVEGVTPENSAQCEKLFEEKLSPVLGSLGDGAAGADVKMFVENSTNLVQIRPGRKQLSLGQIEKALEGSPFSIKREQLAFQGVLQFHIEKTSNHEAHVNALATLDGKELSSDIVKSKDRSLLITLINLKQAGGPVITHQRLTSYLSENKIKLIAISWSGQFHCGPPFGARLATIGK